MKTAKDVLKSIKDNDVKYVDLRFTDPRGKWQHVTFDCTMIEEDAFAEGLMIASIFFIANDPQARARSRPAGDNAMNQVRASG